MLRYQRYASSNCKTHHESTQHVMSTHLFTSSLYFFDPLRVDDTSVCVLPQMHFYDFTLNDELIIQHVLTIIVKIIRFFIIIKLCLVNFRLGLVLKFEDAYQ